MPKPYIKMRDAFIAQGLSDRIAKQKAARIYNAKHPRNPVTSTREAIDNRDNRDNRGMGDN